MFRLISLIFLILVTVTCWANIVPNSGLEENDGKTPAFFTLNNANASLDSTTAHSGKWSVRVKDNATFSTNPIKLKTVGEKGGRVSVSAWAKAEKVVTGNQGWKAGRFILWVRDKDGKAIKIKGSSNDGWVGDFAACYAGTFDWKQFKGNFVLPPGTVDITIEAGLSLTSGTAWIDDLSIDEIPHEWIVKEDPKAQINLDMTSINPRTVLGVGWNWEFVWGPPYEMKAPDEIMEQLFKFAEWDQQSFIRFGYVSQYCMKDDLRTSPPVFNPDGELSIFYKKTLTGLKKLGIPLLVCNWFYGDMSGGYKNPPYPNDRFVESAAVVIDYWVKTDGFTNIKYASLWNEPCWSYPGTYPNDFYEYTKEFHKRLREHGVRDQVKVMGSDSTESGPAVEVWFPRYNRILGKAADAFAFHDYGSNIEAPGRFTSGGTLQPYLESYAKASKALGDKPLFMSEFGSGAFGDEATYIGTIANIELVLGGLNHGVTAFARWAYNCLWDTSVGYSPFLVDGNILQPHKSVYYPYSILTKAVRPGMRVVKCDMTQGRDSAGYKRIHSSALTGDDGSFALVITNDGNEKKTIRINNLPKKKLYNYYYGADLPDGLQAGKVLRPGQTTITIQPMSVTALVSWEWKQLKP
ncbi:MAG: glycoside hydrolase [Armatimonadota bacterium]